MSSRIPLWLDCDTGHDDAFALLLAVHHPRARLLGVSAVHGNAPLDHTHPNACAVLAAIASPPRLPVLRGAEAPLARPPSFADAIHGASGLGGVVSLPAVSPPPVRDSTLADRIAAIAAALLAQPAGTPWIVATGPLTNIALLLQQHPNVADHVAGLSLMGGAVGSGFTDALLGTVEGEGDRFGNWTPYAEFNIVADPEAAQYLFRHPVLRSKGNLVVAGLDLTHLVRGVPAVIDTLFPGNPSLVRRIFKETLTFFSGTYATQFGILDGPPLHDPLAVYAVLEPELFDDRRGERFNVDVVIERQGYDKDKDPTNRTGQTVLEPLPPGSLGARVPRAVDLGRFWGDIDRALDAAEKAVAAAQKV